MPTADSTLDLSPTARHDGQGHGQHLALPAHLLAVIAAARAVPQVVAQPAPAKRAAAQVRQLLAYLRARSLARVTALDQPAASAEHERLHARDLAAEHACHLGVRQARRLGEQQGGPLLLRELAQVAEQLAQLGPACDLLVEPLGGELHELRGLLATRAQHRQAAVARDRVEPRLERQLALTVALKVIEGRRKRVLDGVLGLLRRAEHVAAEARGCRRRGARRRPRRQARSRGGSAVPAARPPQGRAAASTGASGQACVRRVHHPWERNRRPKVHPLLPNLPAQPAFQAP